MMSLHKLTLRNSDDHRKMKHLVEDFWLLPLGMKAVKEGLKAGKRYGVEVRTQGRGHGLGPPHIHVALNFLQALHQQAFDMHQSEGVDKNEETAWAELTLKRFLQIASLPTFGQAFCTETIQDFSLVEAYNGPKDEGLLIGSPSAGQAKAAICFNANPQLQVALWQHKDAIGEDKWKEFGTYSAGNPRMATGILLMKFGGTKSDAKGPKTQMERVVEGNLRKMNSRSTW